MSYYVNNDENATEQGISSSEEEIILQALCDLRKTKVEALETTKREGMAFDARDFGIPQIDRLISVFGGEGVGHE